MDIVRRAPDLSERATDPFARAADPSARVAAPVARARPPFAPSRAPFRRAPANEARVRPNQRGDRENGRRDRVSEREVAANEPRAPVPFARSTVVSPVRGIGPVAEVLRAEVSEIVDMRDGLCISCAIPRRSLFVTSGVDGYADVREAVSAWAPIRSLRGWRAFRYARRAAAHQGPRDAILGTALATDSVTRFRTRGCPCGVSQRVRRRWSARARPARGPCHRLVGGGHRRVPRDLAGLAARGAAASDDGSDVSPGPLVQELGVVQGARLSMRRRDGRRLRAVGGVHKTRPMQEGWRDLLRREGPLRARRIAVMRAATTPCR